MRIPRSPASLGDRQDRRADRVRTVAHQVVAVVAERRGADRAAGRRRPARQRPRRAPAPASTGSSSDGEAATSATTGASTAARVASGSYANIVRTLASTTCGRVDGHDLARRASRRPCARAARSWSASHVGGIERRAIGEEGGHRAHDLGRLVETAQELLDVEAGRRLERLPAAVDQDEPGAALARAPAAARPRRSPRTRGRRGRPGRRGSSSRPEPSATASASSARVGEVVAPSRSARRRGRGRAGPSRRRAGRARSRRATGVQIQAGLPTSPWISRTPGPVRRSGRAAPVEEVDPVARRRPRRRSPSGSAVGIRGRATGRGLHRP